MIFEKEVNKKICDCLTIHPGIRASKIAEMLNLKVAEVEFSLQELEEKRRIIATEDGGDRQYYLYEKRIKARDKRTRAIRRRISGIIMQNPGLHLSKIAELLDMSIPLTDYHLTHMEKHGELTSVKDDRGYYKRYYLATSGIGIQDKKVLEVLQKKIPLQIVVFLLQHSYLKHKEILKRLDIAPSTLSYHINRMVESEILEVRSHGKEKGYSLANVDEVIRILKKYELHIEFQLAVERFKDLWESFDYRHSMEH